TLITIPLYKKIQKSLDALTSHIRENLTGVRVIRAFSKNAEEEKEFRKDNDRFYNLSLLTGRISILLNPLTLIIVNVGMVILLSTSSYEVNVGNLTNGMVYALVNYMSQILIELVKLSNLFITINRSLASASRIEETIETKETLPNEGTLDARKADSASDNLISFKDVSFTYPSAMEASLKDINIGIKEGETIGIIGATGSGKTTVSNLLMRFYDVTSGEILYKDKNIKDYTLSSLRRTFALVPQKAELFSGTLKDNLLIAENDATDEEMINALKAAEAYDFVSDKGKGLELEIKEGGTNLSGGQKQRLCIARALVKKSPVLILDDSSSALDYATDARLRANLKELKKTVIIISQRIVSTKHADKIVVLDDGAIDAIGTHEELLKTSSLYKEIYESQNTEEASL
ncbi:MAG: ABC transporter ATP-binding protein, partial [Lachnospiraceae bacterium]|nr:ABC transporter ATP-binding protein [Lachnospiraceae bacterium]